MNIIDIIEKKKKNIHLSKAEIEYVIDGYMQKQIADYQISALLMAIYFNGMNIDETINLTKAMIASGDVVDLSMISKPTVDKHSTGGVGDKVSLILTPILACFDLAVAKMSGRGLGHTGGTLDKLESIEGFEIEISEERFLQIVETVGMSIIGQTKELVPADKSLYALRDVTATVDSIPLIASSIMSKKIASGAQTIILDVKYGEGAFMKTDKDAQKLAKTLVEIGNGLGRKTIALVTNMQQPLGKMVGNSLEVQEALDVLSGCGPNDIDYLCKQLAVEFLIATNKINNHQKALLAVEEVIANGSALQKFKQFVIAQGASENSLQKLQIADTKTTVYAEKTANIKQINATEVGLCAMQIGAGREKYTDQIDHSVGIEVHIKIGDKVKVGQQMYTIYHHQSQNVEKQIERLHHATKYSLEQVITTPIIEQVID